MLDTPFRSADAEPSGPPPASWIPTLLRCALVLAVPASLLVWALLIATLGARHPLVTTPAAFHCLHGRTSAAVIVLGLLVYAVVRVVGALARPRPPRDATLARGQRRWLLVALVYAHGVSLLAILLWMIAYQETVVIACDAPRWAPDDLVRHTLLGAGRLAATLLVFGLAWSTAAGVRARLRGEPAPRARLMSLVLHAVLGLGTPVVLVWLSRS